MLTEQGFGDKIPESSVQWTLGASCQYSCLMALKQDKVTLRDPRGSYWTRTANLYGGKYTNTGYLKEQLKYLETKSKNLEIYQSQEKKSQMNDNFHP